jgi:hypothetical protein
VSAHHVSEGDQVRVLLGDSVVSTLEPWAYAVVDAQAAAASAPVVGPARDSEIVDDADEPALWSLPAVSVQLGIPSLEEGVPSSGQQDEASPELGLSNPSVSRRSGAAGSPEHASTLWDVPVQGALELGRRDASREGGESLDVEPGSWRREFVADTPEPGSLSLRPRGDVRLTLSVARSEILLSRDGTSLNERHGAAAEELAKAWLRIRPSGGRIWVDEDGFATTLVGGELLSLGRVPTGWVLE